MSIFYSYFATQDLYDQLETQPQSAVDVIIPIMNTNALWKSNLLSVYREIPVNRLLIGDGGCTDDSIDIAREFPRVVIFDHSEFVSLGYSIRKLIEAVGTDWFVYLHSDVHLPSGWFDAMETHKDEYDWYECNRKMTYLVETDVDLTKSQRPYSGSQMGRKEAFLNILPIIEDDYLYRNEDIILADLIQRAGFRYGRVEETFHYHQVMQVQDTSHSNSIRSVTLNREINRETEIRTRVMQVKGLIKYLQPSERILNGVQLNILRLLELDALNWNTFRKWVMETNPDWWKHVKPIKHAPFRRRLENFLKAAYHLVFG